MTRSGLIPTMLFVLVALVVSTSAGQGWGRMGHRGPPPGQSAPQAAVPPAAGPQVLDLNQKIVEAQRELWDLKQRRAGQEAIDAKRNEVLQYRYELARLLTDLPVGASVAATPGGPALPLPRASAGSAPPPPMVGPPPGARAYGLEAGYRLPAPTGPPAPSRLRSAGPAVPAGSPAPLGRGVAALPPPPPAMGLPRGPRVYRIEVGYRPTAAITQPHRRPCARAVPRRIEQSQQQSQGCRQQQQQQQSSGGQQQQQQMGRGQQQQQQQQH